MFVRKKSIVLIGKCPAGLRRIRIQVCNILDPDLDQNNWIRIRIPQHSLKENFEGYKVPALNRSEWGKPFVDKRIGGNRIHNTAKKKRQSKKDILFYPPKIDVIKKT